MKKILVTGAAGFIGFHLANKILDQGGVVFGIDNISPYYDVNLKKSRLSLLKKRSNFHFSKGSLGNRRRITELFASEQFDAVVHLAAQPGVRYSLINPYSYVDSNIVGFINILEGCRRNKVKHLVFASSSSVYGGNTKMPFSVHDNVDNPISLYAATKKANELMAHSYAHLYNLPCTGLRFFTVYGPWGRPDMAYFSFTKAILEGKSLDIFNNGNMQRDFTYIDDVVEGVVRVLNRIPAVGSIRSKGNDEPAASLAPYKIYNIGNHKPVALMNFIEVLEKYLGKKANKKFLPMQAGDVPATYADVDDLMRDVGFKPSTTIEEGLKKFTDWYKVYYK